MAIRNRIVDHITVKGKDLQDNQGNWRVHPQMQRDALNGVLAEVGIVDELIVYQSERQGGLTILDGHLRAGEHPDVEWPCTVLDLTDEEADLVLATFDPLAGMAEASGEKLAELLAGIQPDQEALQMMLDRQRAESELARLMAQAEEALSGLAVPKASNPIMGDRDQQKLITLVVWVEDLADLERAILAVGNPNRGEAIMEICRAYLGEHGG